MIPAPALTRDSRSLSVGSYVNSRGELKFASWMSPGFAALLAVGDDTATRLLQSELEARLDESEGS